MPQTKAGTSILTAINLSRELNNPLMEALLIDLLILFRIRRIKKKVKFYLKHPKFSIKKMYSTIKYIV